MCAHGARTARGGLASCLLLAALLAGGCASVGQFKGLPLRDSGVYVSGVPPVRQDQDYACGPACLAAVAAHWGVSLADFTARHPRLPADTTGGDLQKLAGDLGLQAVAYRGSLEDLRQNLDAGRPVIVMIPMPLVARGGLVADLILNAWNAAGPRPAHWVVVLGMTGDGRLIVHDPASGPLWVKREDFEEWWAQKDHLCVLVAAPPEAPAKSG